MIGDLGAAGDGYRGAARLRVGPERFDVQVELRGFFQPIDGRSSWYGRIAADDRLGRALAGQRAAGVLETGQGASPCELSEPDEWGRYRVTGRSAPPFGVAAAAFHAAAPGPQQATPAETSRLEASEPE